MDKIITRILKYGVLISTYLLIGSVLLQIFARYLLPSTPAWTEEASRMFFVYAIAFASGLALKDGYYVYLEFFFEKFPHAIRPFLSTLISILVAVLILCVAFYSVSFVLLGIDEHSPSMKFSMSYVFAGMIILGVSMGYFALKNVLRELKGVQS